MDTHERQRMDDDGFLGHDRLIATANQRLLKAAIRYCEHVGSSVHDERRTHNAMMTAYMAWRAAHDA